MSSPSEKHIPCLESWVGTPEDGGGETERTGSEWVGWGTREKVRVTRRLETETQEEESTRTFATG